MERLKTYNYPINLLVDILDDDDAVLMVVEEQLKLNGIINYRMFTDPDKFLAGLHEKPHICIVDFMLGGVLNGLDVSRIVLSKNKDCKVIMVSGVDGDLCCKTMREFFYIGGSGWADKNDTDFKGQLVSELQKAIGFIRDELERRERLEQKEGSVIRKDRKPLANENTDTA